jgi:hypothetical protein
MDALRENDMTQANYSGRCVCGSVRFECSAEPRRMFNCHCTDCQRATGSGYAPVLVFSRDAVKLTGDIKYYSWTSERGTVLERGFCPTCGNPVFVVASDPAFCVVYAPSLDDPKLYRPEDQRWTRSAQPWDKFDQTIPCYEKGPS